MMKPEPCPTALTLAVGESSEVDALTWTFVETGLRRGLRHPDTYTALNNLHCAVADESPAESAAALRRLAIDADAALGPDSLTSIRVAANAAAFTGISGDIALAHSLYQQLIPRATGRVPAADLQRIRTNAAHWEHLANGNPTS